MAGEPLLKLSNPSKSLLYRKIPFHRFFVGLLLFIVISLVFTVVYNSLSSGSPRTDFHEPVNLEDASVEVLQLPNRAAMSEKRLSNCTYWECFNVYRCGRGGHDKITIYIYPLKEYQTDSGSPISRFSREFYIILDTIKRSKYYTADPHQACLLIPSVDTLNQHKFSSKHVSQVLQSLEQ